MRDRCHLRPERAELLGDLGAERPQRYSVSKAEALLARRQDEDIPADDYEFNQKNMNWLLFYQLTHTQSSLFIFEFLRLTGQDDKYLKFLEDYTFELFVIEEQRDRGIPEEDRAEDLKENEEQYREMYDEFMTSRKKLFNQPRRVFKVYA